MTIYWHFIFNMIKYFYLYLLKTYYMKNKVFFSSIVLAIVIIFHGFVSTTGIHIASTTGEVIASTTGEVIA